MSVNTPNVMVNRKTQQMNKMRWLGLTGLILSVAACTATPPPKPVVVVPPPAIIIPPRPTPPNSAAPTLLMPARGIDGRFITVNSGITGERSVWQMRIALNVAAIGCRGVEEATMIAAYNQLLKVHGKAFSAAEKRVISELGKATGTNGIAERDRFSTKLFNYFAQPPAQAAFCNKANQLAQLVATTPTAQIIPTSELYLTQLDQPFHDFYEAYAAYQRDVIAWDARYGPPVTYAAPTTTFVPLAQPGTAPVTTTALPPSTAVGSGVQGPVLPPATTP